MECNKDEAVRAMQLSEKKILNNDFKAAKALALKAQQLYPQLDNVFRLIIICEVHCSAEKKIGGSEMDWYGILQVQQSDDREIIKKQYKKLGLLLHPDKTSLAGAEAAFKLVGEAYRMLYDQVTRSQYDIKYRILMGSVSRQLGHQFGRKYSSAASSKPQSWYASVNLQQPQNVQQPVQPETIKRGCPSCKRMYDYNFANRLIFCHRCLGIFDASDMGSESLGNQFVNPTVAQATQSNRWTGTRSSTTFRNGNATSEVASAAEVGGGFTTAKREIENVVERSKSIPLKPKKSRKSGNSSINFGNSSKTGKGAEAEAEAEAEPEVIVLEKVAEPEVIVLEKVAEPSVVSEDYTRRSPRNIRKPSYVETSDHNVDNNPSSVIVNGDGNGNVAPLKVRKSTLSTATKRKRANVSADGEAYRPIVMALFATEEYKKLGKQRGRRKKNYASSKSNAFPAAMEVKTEDRSWKTRARTSTVNN